MIDVIIAEGVYVSRCLNKGNDDFLGQYKNTAQICRTRIQGDSKTSLDACI